MEYSEHPAIDFPTTAFPECLPAIFSLIPRNLVFASSFDLCLHSA